MTRDVLLDMTPPVALMSPWYLVTTCLAGVCVFFFAKKIALSWRLVLYADAVGLGLFVAVGAEKAWIAGLGPVGIMVIATIASCGGGVIRDVLTHEIPTVFTDDIYATAAIVGAALYLAAQAIGVDRTWAFGMGMAAVLALRLAAVAWGLRLPVARVPPAAD